MKKNQYSRRNFLGTSALGAAGVIGAAGLISSCADEKLNVTVTAPLKKALDGTPIKAALIGCGGRGSGAAIDLLNAGDNIEIVAAADVLQDKMDNFRKKLKDQKGVELADEKCFIGFDAYEKALAEDINYVILATPPHFRQEHFEALVTARKHVFL